MGIFSACFHESLQNFYREVQVFENLSRGYGDETYFEEWNEDSHCICTRDLISRRVHSVVY